MGSMNRLWVLLTILCIQAIVGCGRSGTARVTGRVMYKDGTIPQGGICIVNFRPTGDSPAKIRKAASAEIQKDGFFEAFTRNPGDGVFLGKYDVTFTILQDHTNSDTSLIDPMYTRAKTTPYHVTIDGNVDDLKFELDHVSPSNKK